MISAQESRQMDGLLTITPTKEDGTNKEGENERSLFLISETNGILHRIYPLSSLISTPLCCCTAHK